MRPKPVPKTSNWLVTLGDKVLPCLQINTLEEVYELLTLKEKNTDTFVCFHPRAQHSSNNNCPTNQSTTEEHIHIIISIAIKSQKLQKVLLFLKRQLLNNIIDKDALRSYLKATVTNIHLQNANSQITALLSYPNLKNNSDTLKHSDASLQRKIFLFGQLSHTFSSGEPTACFVVPSVEVMLASGMVAENYFPPRESSQELASEMANLQSLDDVGTPNPVVGGEITRREATAREKWDVLENLILETNATTLR